MSILRHWGWVPEQHLDHFARPAVLSAPVGCAHARLAETLSDYLNRIAHAPQAWQAKTDTVA